MIQTWSPTVGNEARRLLDASPLPEQTRALVLSEAVAIMSKCPAPANSIPSRTGLALGYVQSGKTLSYTTLAALARDNNFPLIVILAGTTIPLFNQSTNRITRDLQYNMRDDRKWLLFENPTVRANFSALESLVNGWKNPDYPVFLKKTALITVMKNASRIRKVGALLNALPLEHLPILIIDDEADQAGLNTKVRQRQFSATNSAIIQLRTAAPRHAYIEYTATPQALLLISIIDSLSPQFVQVLSPGPDYVGGKDYFVHNRELIKTIPANELPIAANNLVEAPPSFVYSLQLFFVGVAAGMITEQGEGNRSMMIHPSRLRDDHGDYFKWATRLKQSWTETVTDKSDPDRPALLEKFRPAYDELDTSVPNLPPFDDIAKNLEYAFLETEIVELNARSGHTPVVNWKDHYPFILVGGQAMDRGFTVAGLTITYMPRGLGQGYADSFQQRARFLGYKRRELGYCRVFLDAGAASAFRNYVMHEEDVRTRLQDLGNESLETWKRRFYLDPVFEPTRRSVIDLQIIRTTMATDWFSPSLPYIDPETSEFNRSLFEEYVGQLPTPLNELYGQDAAYQLPLRDAFERLLLEFKHADPRDAERFASYLLRLGFILERNGSETCDLFLMRWATQSGRSKDASGIKELFSGRRPKTGPLRYPGDRAICRDNQIAIQLHKMDIYDGDQRTTNSKLFAANVPIIALRIPSTFTIDGIEQPGNP